MFEENKIDLVANARFKLSFLNNETNYEQIYNNYISDFANTTLDNERILYNFYLVFNGFGFDSPYISNEINFLDYIKNNKGFSAQDIIITKLMLLINLPIYNENVKALISEYESNNYTPTKDFLLLKLEYLSKDFVTNLSKIQDIIKTIDSLK